MESFSVSQFLDFLNAAMTTAVFPEGVAVEGEVTEYRVSQGKWVWFSLKDADAVVPCFATVWGLRQPLEDGMAIRAYGRPKVHPRSGKFSLNVERVEAVGAGALRRSFELLKSKLEKEGIFDSGRKRPLPRFPSRIGLITSVESAAYGDFLRVLENRWRGAELVVADVQVQGAAAVGQVTAALEDFSRRPEGIDLLVLIRGGGSLEDLQAFNTEEVCRAVFASPLPVVVGVGHERDVSLADLAADVRASTPSNAAEIIFPDRAEIGESLDSSVFRLASGVEGRLAARKQAVNRLVSGLEAGIRRPKENLERLTAEIKDRFSGFRSEILSRKANLTETVHRLMRDTESCTSRLHAGLDAKRRLIISLDPRRLLQRGYAIVRFRGKVLKSIAQAAIGQAVGLQLSDGVLEAKITGKEGHKKK